MALSYKKRVEKWLDFRYLQFHCPAQIPPFKDNTVTRFNKEICQPYFKVGVCGQDDDLEAEHKCPCYKYSLDHVIKTARKIIKDLS
jgi:hypothetical protein